MIDFRLLLITDRRVSPDRALHDVVAAACGAGLRAVQLRERDLGGRELLDLARQLRDATSPSGARLFINDRVDIALAVEADGVHCPEEGWPPIRVKSMAEGMVGVSAHSVGAARRAHELGADFVLFGPVFATPSKAAWGDPQGISRLRDVAAAVTIPVFAVGGVTPANAPLCLQNGAAGVAAIRALLGAHDTRRAVEEFERVMGGL